MYNFIKTRGVIKIYYVYRFLNKDKGVLYLDYTKQLTHEIREVSFTKKLAEQVCRIEYICVEKEADAEMVVVYFNSVLNPPFKNKDKLKFYEDLSFRFDELDNKEWTTYEKINDFKWRKELIREVYQVQLEKEKLINRLSYLEEKGNKLYNLTTEFESDFHKKTFELNILGINQLIEEMEGVKPSRRRSRYYRPTLYSLRYERDFMVRSLRIYKKTIGKNVDIYFDDYEDYLDSLIELEDRVELISEELLKKEKLLEQMEVV